MHTLGYCQCAVQSPWQSSYGLQLPVSLMLVQLKVAGLLWCVHDHASCLLAEHTSL